MVRLSLFMSLLLTSVAVLTDVQTNIRRNVCILPCAINNGQNIAIDSGNINPEHIGNSYDEITETISISCTYKSGSSWIEVTGSTMAGQTNVLATSIADFGIALYQGKGMSTPLTLGNGSGDGYRVTAGLNTARSTFTFTPMPFRDGSKTLNGEDFRTTAGMSTIYN